MIDWLVLFTVTLYYYYYCTFSCHTKSACLASCGVTKMALFIIPEGAATGKGSNQVISMLHFYLKNLCVGETEVVLNADNCVGLNKNQFMMSYICWWVLSGLHKITLHFLVAGHTKFSPDYAGGVFKKIFGILHAQHRLMLQSVPKSPQYFTLISLDQSMESSNMYRHMTGRVNLQSFAAFQE